jgi:hypothetical protein
MDGFDGEDYVGQATDGGSAHEYYEPQSNDASYETYDAGPGRADRERGTGNRPRSVSEESAPLRIGASEWSASTRLPAFIAEPAVVAFDPRRCRRPHSGPPAFAVGARPPALVEDTAPAKAAADHGHEGTRRKGRSGASSEPSEERCDAPGTSCAGVSPTVVESRGVTGVMPPGPDPAER